MMFISSISVRLNFVLVLNQIPCCEVNALILLISICRSMYTIDWDSGRLLSPFKYVINFFTLIIVIIINIKVPCDTFSQSWFQLWVVFYLYTRFCIPISHTCTRFHHKANGEPVENICEAVCCTHVFSWINKGLLGLSKLSGTNHVQIH